MTLNQNDVDLAYAAAGAAAHAMLIMAAAEYHFPPDVSTFANTTLHLDHDGRQWGRGEGPLIRIEIEMGAVVRLPRHRRPTWDEAYWASGHIYVPLRPNPTEVSFGSYEREEDEDGLLVDNSTSGSVEVVYVDGRPDRVRLSVPSRDPVEVRIP